MKRFVFVLAAFVTSVVVLGIVVGCAQTSGTTTTTTTTSTTTTTFASAILTHFGFDFATGVETNEAGAYDGEVINWNPDNVTTTVEGTTYPSYSTYLWWRGQAAAANQKHIGTGELSAVTTVPQVWDSSSSIWPLLVGHVYVVRCSPEGYARFKVIQNYYPSWEVSIQYSYTTEAVFH